MGLLVFINSTELSDDTSAPNAQYLLLNKVVIVSSLPTTFTLLI